MKSSGTAVDLDEVVAAIRSRPRRGAVRLVGIDGPSGSGKSMLARMILGRLDATLVQIDDFVSWPDFAGWWPRFDQDVLTPLLAGRNARYQARDWANDEFGTSLGPWKTAEHAPVVVVEGVTATRRCVVDRLAYAIWVEAPHETRLARGIERDGESHRHLWLDWMVAEHEFFAADRTRERADLRVCTTSSVPHDRATQLVSF